MSIALQEQTQPLSSGGGGGGSGDVTGPASSTDNTLPRFDGTGGKTLQGSGVVVDDSNSVSGVTGLNMTGNITVSGTVDGRDVSVDGAKLDDMLAFSWANDDVFIARPSGNNDPIGLGVKYNTAATGSATVQDDGGGLLSQRSRCTRMTDSSAGSLAEFHTTNLFLWGQRGFKYVKDFGWNPSASCRMFAGLYSSISALTNADIANLTNCIGLARIDSSTNVCLIHNDASGTVTVALDTGIAANSNANHLWRLSLDRAAGASTVTYKVERMSYTGVTNTSVYQTWSGTISSDLPSLTTSLGDRLFITNNLNAVFSTVMFCRMNARSTPLL